MSLASEFREAAQAATIYEVMGQSGASYVIFWFDDSSVCAARKLPTDNKAVARLEFGETKICLKDCGIAYVGQTTYQMGAELLKRMVS
jgi:hypothetical protein